MFTIASGYPGDAIGGADFFTASGQREILDVGPTGHEFRRKERIVVVDRLILTDDLIEGRPCIGEQTVRALGAELGLYDEVVVNRLRDDLERTRERAIEAETENARLRSVVADLQRLAPRADGLTMTPLDFIETVKPLEDVTP